MNKMHKVILLTLILFCFQNSNSGIYQSLVLRLSKTINYITNYFKPKNNSQVLIMLTPLQDSFHIKLFSLDNAESKESNINKEIYNELKKYITTSYRNATGEEIFIISKKNLNDIFNKKVISHICIRR